jgi:tryptophanyl-tRNA synthetase
VDAPKDPDANNVFNLLRLFVSEPEQAEWRERFLKGGLKYSEAKMRLLQILDETFGPAREKRKDLAKDRAYVEDVLREGAKRVRPIAWATLARARKACGID